MKQLNDQYFTYRQTPVDYDGVARPSIKGNTLVWNQLVQNGNFASTSNWAKDHCTLSVSSNQGTMIANNQFGGIRQDINTIVGHKYFICVDVLSSSQSVNIRSVDGGISADSSKTSWEHFTFIITATNATTDLRLRDGASSGWVDQYFKNVMCLDLTLMGIDTLTLEQVQAWFSIYFPLPYYAYGQYLLNFNGTGIKTVGFNQWDEEWELGGIDSSTGQNSSSSSRIRSKNYVSVFPETVYYFKNSPSIVYALRYYDENKTFISAPTSKSESGTFTTPSNCYYLRFISVQTTYNNDICINISDTDVNGTYKPYTSNETDIPISTYFPTGMKSAGTGTSKVYDELNDKATTRVGTITFDGTQANVQADISSSQCRVMYAVSDIKGKSSSTEEVDYGLTSNYLPNSANSNTYDGQPGIHRRTNGSQQIVVSLGKNSGISNFTEWNAYLSAHPLQVNYELATYTEQDVDPIYYDFYGNGTEQLLPVNTDTPTTSPLLADIIYYNLTDSEVPYRVFWAINSKGERWDFTEREFKSFMNNPQGLGFSKTISVNRYGNVQNLTDITDNFPQPNGEILFYDSHNSTRYDKYNQFVKFLSYEPITLYYKIPVSFYSRIPNTYSLECVVGTLTKTESKTDNMMNCSITYNALSFYKGEEVEISGTGLTYTINNDGDFPVGFEIEINATYNFYMKNPYIQLSQDGSLYGEAKFIDDTRFNKVYINSKDGEQNVILQQSGSVLPNPMSYQDLSISNGSIYVTFVKLARGETTLTIGADSQNITDVTIKYTPIYRSV